MFKILIYLFVAVTLFGCKERIQPIFVKNMNIPAIKVEIADTSFTQVERLLETDKYVVLSSTIPLGAIKRIYVENERIYILDNEPKIICYDFEGKPLYQIASKGAGPKEFSNIIDFAVNSSKNQLTIYDSGKRRLVHYDLTNGKYKSDLKMNTAPLGLAFINDVYYLHNPYNYNYPKKKDLWYSLFYSFNGNTVDGKFFPHNEIISNYHFSGINEHPFYYNDTVLIYNKLFDDMVYELGNGKVEPVYQIELPNPVSLDLLKEKIKPIDLINGPFSSCLSDLYRCDSILYFSFIHEKSWIFAFFDLKNNKTIYCGRQISNNPTKELLVYHPIRGRYKDSFYSIIQPEAIQEKIEMDSIFFPDDLKKLTFEDNPVIMFYKVKK